MRRQIEQGRAELTAGAGQAPSYRRPPPHASYQRLRITEASLFECNPSYGRPVAITAFQRRSRICGLSRPGWLRRPPRKAAQTLRSEDETQRRCCFAPERSALKED